jgi:ribonucleoside-diphosphate reductase alpha chain
MQPTEITKESAKASVATLPEQEIGEEVLLEKYAKGAERTATDVRRRVARALAAVEAEDKRAHGRRSSSRRRSAGSCPPAASTGRRHFLTATLINCLVQLVGDSDH